MLPTGGATTSVANGVDEVYATFGLAASSLKDTSGAAPPSFPAFPPNQLTQQQQQNLSLHRTARAADAAATTMCVVTTASDGHNTTGTTLRQCFEELTKKSGRGVGGEIQFNIQTSSSSASGCNITIELESPLPVINGT